VSLTIKEAFRVEAPPDLVWEFLLSPTDVVRCLPGADLTDTIDDRTFAGRVKVKVGPIATAYVGQARVVEIDAAARRMKMVGEGKEMGGSGSARLTMTGSVVALDDAASEVHVDATIDIAGKVMQFGRGLVESVSRQMFKQFAEATQATLVRATGERAALALAAPPAETDTDPEPAPAAATESLQTTLSHSATFTAEHRSSVEQVSLFRLFWRLVVDRVRRIFR
jgi:uncharacterized protein